MTYDKKKSTFNSLFYSKKQRNMKLRIVLKDSKLDFDSFGQ